MLRLCGLRALGGPEGALARRPPRLAVRRASRRPRSRLGFAVPEEHRISVTAYPGIRRGDAEETLLHELVHVAVGPSTSGRRWHGREFRATLARGDARGLRRRDPDERRYHGAYADALERRRAAEADDPPGACTRVSWSSRRTRRGPARGARGEGPVPRVAAPLLAVDTPSMLYRAFFALPKSIKGADGKPGQRAARHRQPGPARDRAARAAGGRPLLRPRRRRLPDRALRRLPRRAPGDAGRAARASGTARDEFFTRFGWTVADHDSLEADDLLGSLAKAEAAAGGRRCS